MIKKCIKGVELGHPGKEEFRVCLFKNSFVKSVRIKDLFFDREAFLKMGVQHLRVASM